MGKVIVFFLDTDEKHLIVCVCVQTHVYIKKTKRLEIPKSMKKALVRENKLVYSFSCLHNMDAMLE